ncbi:MAG: gas vesicle protein GvpG [Deltaproteobacteria bacterium]
MIVLDSLLVGGIRFVLGKVAAAVEAELDDEEGLKNQLLEAQMQLELGQLSEAEFRNHEAALLAELRRIREAKRGLSPGDELRVTGVEAIVEGHRR